MRNLTPEMEQLLAEAGRLRVGDAALRARGGSGAGAEQPAARQDPRRGHGCRPRHARGRGLWGGIGVADEELFPIETVLYVSKIIGVISMDNPDIGAAARSTLLHFL